MSGWQQSKIGCNRKKILSKMKYVTQESDVITRYLSEMLSELQQKTSTILKEDDVNFISHFDELNCELENVLEKLFLVQDAIDPTSKENSTFADGISENSMDHLSVCNTSSPDASSFDRGCLLTSHCNIKNVTDLNADLHDTSLKPVPAIAEASTNKLGSAVTQLGPFPQNNISLIKFENCDGMHSDLAHVTKIGKCSSTKEHLAAETQLSVNWENKTFSATHHLVEQNPSLNHDNENNNGVLFSDILKDKNVPSCVSDSEKNIVSQKEFVNIDGHRNCTKFCNFAKPESIPELDIKLGDHIIASITHYTNPSDFWLQIEDSTTKTLCPVSVSFSCNLNHQRSIEFPVTEHGFCLAPFDQQGSLYRAKILNFCEPERNARVFFVDHGREGHVPITNLRSLPKQLYAFPALAIHCFIHGVVPANGTWSLKAITEFEETYKYSNIKPYVYAKVEDKYSVGLSIETKIEGEDFAYDMTDMLISYEYTVSKNEKEMDIQEKEPLTAQPSCLSATSTSMVLQENHIHNRGSIDPDHPPSISENYLTSSNLEARFESGKSSVLEQLHPSNSGLEEKNNISLKANSEKSANGSSKSCKTEASTDEFYNFQKHDTKNDTLPQGEHRGVSCSPSQIKNDADFFHSEKYSEMTSCGIMNDYDWNVVVPVRDFDYTEGDKLIVMMSSVVSPSELYVNIASGCVMDFDDLQDQLLSVYNVCSLSDFTYPVDGLQPNMFCCCCYSVDKNWYRAKILNVHYTEEKLQVQDEKDKQFHVQYIDYGNTDIVSIQNIYPLRKDFAKYPTFSICCSLVGIKPKLKTFEKQGSSSYVWSDETVQKLQTLVAVEKLYTAEVVTSGKYSESCAIPICLWATDSTTDILINALLGEQIVIDEVDFSLLSSYSLENKDGDYFNDPMAVDYYSPLNSYGVNLDDVEVATVGYKAKDERYTCKFYSQFGSCHRKDNCPYQHLRACGDRTQDKEAILFLGESISLPEISDYFIVSVSAVLNPGHFFVVFPYGNKPISKLLMSNDYDGDHKEVEDLDTLMGCMRDHYNSISFAEPTTVALACGDIVAAKSEIDQSWCRGRVIDVFDVTAPAQIFFVDFGSCEYIDRSNVHSLKPEFRHLPFQAVECRLTNIAPPVPNNRLEWNKESRTKFVEFVQGKILFSHVINIIGSVLYVELFSINENRICNINETLIKTGNAQFNLDSSNGHQTANAKSRVSSLLPG